MQNFMENLTVGSTPSLLRWTSFILPAAGTGASGQVQDLQGHHQDDQEQLLDHFKAG